MINTLNENKHIRIINNFEQLIENKEATHCVFISNKDDINTSLTIQMGFLYNIGIKNSIFHYFLRTNIEQDKISLSEDAKVLNEIPLNNNESIISDLIFSGLSDNFMSLFLVNEKYKECYYQHMNAVKADLSRFLLFEGNIEITFPEHDLILFDNLVSDVFPFTFLTKNNTSKIINIHCYKDDDERLYSEVENLLLSSELNSDTMNINKRRI